MSQLLYSNGRIAVLSTKLFGKDKFNRLSECSYISEALRVLSESGYGNGVTVENPNDYEQVLIAELDSAIALFKELCPDKAAVRYFLCKYNYHNAKVLMKSKYMRTDGTSGCFSQVDVAPQDMLAAFVNDDYSLCSSQMAEACDKIDGEFAEGRRSPQLIDAVLDKAMFSEMHKCARRCSVSLVSRLFDWEVNTINLMLLYRLKKAAKTKDDLENWLLEGGSVKRTKLIELWDNDSVASDLPDMYRKFYALCTMQNQNLLAAEAAQKAQRNQLVHENPDFLTIQPILDYFFQKVDEIDKVRLVLINIKNGTDKEKIKDMIKN